MTAGLNGISVRDLSDNVESLENELSSLINEIISWGLIPDDLKTAIVVPIYKGGPRNPFFSYRPISVLPCICKILEKHVLFFMKSFLDKHNIISSSQYGFVSNRGTSSLLDVFSDSSHSSFDNHYCGCSLFLGVAKRHLIQLTITFY
uniref:Putative jockey ele1 orf2-h 1e-120-j 4 n=1 Tax=Ixodes ricinus TaxID=34613 RepID=A0A0K8RLB3_IXORI